MQDDLPQDPIFVLSTRHPCPEPNPTPRSFTWLYQSSQVPCGAASPWIWPWAARQCCARMGSTSGPAQRLEHVKRCGGGCGHHRRPGQRIRPRARHFMAEPIHVVPQLCTTPWQRVRREERATGFWTSPHLGAHVLAEAVFVKRFHCQSSVLGSASLRL